MNPIEWLPHGPPMRLVEEVVELRVGEFAWARRTAHASDWYFQGHFPGDPVVPAMVLAELLAQTGGLAAAPAAPTKPLGMRIAGFGPFKFPAAARPGVTLDVRARVVGRIGGLIRIEGDVTADGEIVAAGSVTLSEGVARPAPALHTS